LAFVCPACRSSEGRDIVPAAQNPAGLSVTRCRRCDLISAFPLPSAEELARRYTPDYFQTPTPNEGGYEDYAGDAPLIARTFARRLSLLPSAPRSGAVLDVGCATGVFLDVLAGEGWRTHGVEIADDAARRARARGHAVIGRRLEDLAGTPARFDLVTLWDVIEHLENPLDALRRCHALLSPGGRLVLTTPDASSLAARLLGRRWLGFRPVGEHVYFFGRKTISAFAEQAGFRVERVTSVGKYFTFERLVTRLCYYTRLFRLLGRVAHPVLRRVVLYVNSGDTLCLVAVKK
jgi:2-polyprenyl-3-methyl-5-hydroxy-6-metoxy-1,4-benzoquinol methylase